MKKIFLIFCLIFTTTILSAQSYKIENINYDIDGCKGISFGKTNKISLELKCPVDTNTIFENKEKFDLYVKEYEQQLRNLRAFDTIELSYTELLDEQKNLVLVTLNAKLIDSSHLLALPYPKYDSNSGFNLKIKAKDSNFLGTLNPLSADLYVTYNDTSNYWKTGLNFSYDYPFKAGIFNASWNNSLNIDYQIGNTKPDLSSGIGISFNLPKDMYSINFGFNQSVKYEGIFKFGEKLSFSTPVTLYKAPNFSTVSYSPYINFYFDWDQNIKEINNEDFSISFGQSISNSKVNWNNRFRKGYSFSLNNDYGFKFNEKFVKPSLSFAATGYTNFKLLNKSFLDRFGIYSRLYIFSIIEVPGTTSEDYYSSSIGGMIRGILNNRMPGSPYGVVLNLDLPINLFTSTIGPRLFHFTMQLSPFVDIALTKDTKLNEFNLNTKNMGAGIEVLVFPHRFSSYTIRGSVGVDVKKVIKSSNKLKGMWDNKEIYIGLDLHY